MTSTPDREPRSLEQAKIDALVKAAKAILGDYLILRTPPFDHVDALRRAIEFATEPALAIAAEPPTRREK